VTTGIDLATHKDRLRVLVDGQPVAFTVNQNELEVTMPAAPPGKQAVVVRLQVGPVSIPGERIFTYER
jgi:hypothetical protein